MVIVFGIVIIFLLSKPAPTINIHNKTTKPIYIYTMQSNYLLEPTLEEVQQLKNIKFIKPNYQLSVPVSTSYTNDSELSIAWKIGSRTNTSSSAIRTLINDTKGVCGIDIFVKDNSVEVTKKK